MSPSHVGERLRNRDTDVAVAYHEATKHSEARLRANRHSLDWANEPLPFKVYTDLPPIPLAREISPGMTPALEALGAPPAGPDWEPELERVPDLGTLSRLLQFSAGVTKRMRYPGGEILFRAYPNTGALYHVDLYFASGDLPELELAAGVYHFGVHDFSLRRLREGDYRAQLVAAAGAEPRVAEAPVVLASASTYWRNAWKYQARTYRHCFWDAGTMHANLLAVASAEKLGARVVLGFADREVERLLDLDPRREGALSLVPLGRSAGPAPAAPPSASLRLATAPLSRREVDYPSIRRIHAASSLESGTEVAAWRGVAPLRELPKLRGPAFPLRPRPARELSGESLESVILRRGSTRRFDPSRGLSFDELSTVLERATRGVPADFLEPPGATLIDLYLIVHAVEGLPAGTYFYRRDERALELLGEGQLRGVAGRLGLFQELPATAAVNIYCLCELGPVLERFGNRGYRAAQLEGGILGGRMYLAAYALGFGASGLTFLDDEVIDLFSPHAAQKSVMFLLALGRAARGLRA